MQVGHHVGTRWIAAGYGSSLVAFAVMALFLVDVFNVTTASPGSTLLGSYNANRTYLFPIGYWFEFAITTVALVAGIVLAVTTFYERRR